MRFNLLKLHPLIKHSLFENLPPSLLRACTIQLKINGRCVNKCSFCKFHDDPSLLEVHDIEKFFEMIGHQRFKGLIINGGEPTIHPCFMDICDFLSDRFTGKVRLRLGTNLIPLAWSTERYQNIYKKVLPIFDHFDVGCDD